MRQVFRLSRLPRRIQLILAHSSSGRLLVPLGAIRSFRCPSRWLSSIGIYIYETLLSKATYNCI